MDVHELIEQHRGQIDKAKIFFCHCNYDEALVMFYNAYASNHQLIQDVYALKIASANADAGMSG